MRKGAFLDRDNTLIYDPGYIHEPEKVRLLEGVGEGLKLLKEAGYTLIVVSNQSGIGRGYFKEEDFWAVNEKLQELLLPYKVQIDAFYFCPHKPEEKCSCRKPKIGMALKAQKELKVNLKESVMVGDKESDLIFGVNANLKCSLRVGAPPFENFLKAATFLVENYG